MARDTRLAASRGKGGLSPSKPRLQCLLQGLPWKLESLRPGKAISHPPLGGTLIFWACTIRVLGPTHVHRYTHNTIGTAGGIGGATDSEKVRKEENVVAGIPYVGHHSPNFLDGIPPVPVDFRKKSAGKIPIAQARHRPSLTGTTASPGSPTGKMETCVRARGVSKLGPWLHPDLP